MEFIDKNNSKSINSENDLISFFCEALAYRLSHKDESRKLAKYVFDATGGFCQSSIITSDLLSLRYEFGALEAPGMPDDESLTVEKYDDILWNRLSDLVEKAKKNRTV